MNLVRSIVSQDKIRYEEGNFNLDLTYITPKIIAMAYPGTGIESGYRNPMSAVVNFFEAKHKDHFKIINLTEYDYNPEFFNNNVENYPFPDHHPPTFADLLEIVESCKEFLEADEANIVALHCIAGMGRTGTVICCLLMYLNQRYSPFDALSHFKVIRTANSTGVKNPSQIRCVYNFYNHLNDCHTKNVDPFIRPNPPNLLLKKVTSKKLFEKNHISIYFTISKPDLGVVHNSAWLEKPEFKSKCDYEVTIDMPISGDFTFNFYACKKGLLNQSAYKLVSFAIFNTLFIKNSIIIVPKNLLDKMFKDVFNKEWDENLEMCFHFESLDPDHLLDPSPMKEDYTAP